ncbi:hypothetical protein B0I72DRAFT_141107 [Yarrowia lipolytica]|nr:hypothetical protein B0I72DRAFT_141107 [Yarrowia lipolytica]
MSEKSTRASSEDTVVGCDTSMSTNTTPDLRPRPLRDDSSRGKHLMGDLLGSLQGGKAGTRKGVTGNRGADLTKSDIEQRIRNRRANQGSQESQALKETILRKRRERKKLEMTKRHEKMRNDARFLQTQTRPVITFLPRVLTQEDSAVIKEQCKGVEYDIQREVAKQGDGIDNK